MIHYLKSSVRNIIDKLFPVIPERRYYTNLFTRDPVWSSPNPNFEETLRWNIIQNFVLAIKDQKSLSAIQSYNILDIGCGRGWLSNLLSAYGSVIGIEPVKPVVAWAKQLFPTLDLRHGIAKDLIKEGKTGFFDIIICSEVIEHIPNNRKDKFVKEIYSLLKEDGFLIITTPRKEAELDWKQYGNPNQPIEEWLSEDEVNDLLVSNNFKKHSLSRFSIAPLPGASLIEIYQLWLVQKVKKSQV